MSIIYDALKKIENNVKLGHLGSQPAPKKTAQVSPQTASAKTENAEILPQLKKDNAETVEILLPFNKSKNSKIKFYVLLGIAILLGSLTVYILLDMFTGRLNLGSKSVRARPASATVPAARTPRQPAPTVSFPVPAAVSSPSPASVSAPEVSKPVNAELVVNGVFFSEGEGYALINNMIVRAGEKIGEITVNKINLDGVEVTTGDGQRLSLKVKR